MVTRVLLAIWLTVPAARAVELRLQFPAIERMLSEQLFTEEGRRYVGNKRTKCNFAFLQSPHIESDQGRLRIRAQFSGRTALDLFSRCVGLGDEFPLVITASPTFQGSDIGLTQVTASGDGKNGFYIRRVCAAIADTLARTFRYPMGAEVKRILEDSANLARYPREVGNFSIRGIRVDPTAVVIDLNFDLTVK